ncbi:CoA transferase, partial [Candidatus Entotheonella serta]
TVTGHIKERVGSGSNTASPRNVYKTRDDKWVALSGSVQAMAERVLRLVGRDDMNHDPRYKDNASRVKHREEIDRIVGAWVGKQTREEALKAFTDASVTAAPVYDISDLIQDEHVVGRGIFEELPEEELGWVQHHAPVPRLSETPAGYRQPAPRLGQHTWDVLAEFGFSEDQMTTLRETGIVVGEDQS